MPCARTGFWCCRIRRCLTCTARRALTMTVGSPACAATEAAWRPMVEQSRRRVLVVGAALLGAAACGAKPTEPRLSDPAEPLPPIEDRITALKRRHNARVGLFAADLGSGHTV